MDTEYVRKYELALLELEKSSIRKSSYLPPAHRLLRMLGSKPKPPHYNSYLINAITLTAFFAIGWGLLMWLFLWSSMNMPTSIVVVGAFCAGILFGAPMSVYYKYAAKKHSLSDWDAL